MSCGVLISGTGARNGIQAAARLFRLAGSSRRPTERPLAVCAAARSNGENVDDSLLRTSIEDDAPLADSESPESFWSLQALDVTVRKPTDRGAYTLAILPAKLAEGLQDSRADLDPPAGGLSQRSAPPRPRTKRAPVRFARS